MKFHTLLILIALNGIAVLGSEGISETILQTSIAEAKEKRSAFLLELAVNGAQSKRYGRSINKSTPETLRMGEIVSIYNEALEILVNKHKVDRYSARQMILEARQEECLYPKAPVCDFREKYRRVNGSCNNLYNPLWGSTYIPFERRVSAEYTGLRGDEPRGGLVSKLPPPRDISLKVHANGDDSNPNSTATHILAQFGQFLDHDITLTPEAGRPCCSSSEGTPKPDDCWELAVGKTDDVFYYQKGVSCLDFTRSTPTCTFTPNRAREQMNIITSFIDASNVYGSDLEVVNVLRTFRNGELTENQEISGGFLPWKKEVINGSEETAVIAGDPRVGEMPGLTVIHILFAKEHNRIAKELAEITSWSDEEIYQGTRRILGAQMQQIVYNEYLPAILGPEAMIKFQLSLPPKNNPKTIYNPTINPSIFNSFATAAYRFGHTLVNGLIQLWLEDVHETNNDYQVRHHYFVHDVIIDKDSKTMPGYQKILKGLTKQVAQVGDARFSEDLTNHLFRQQAAQYGSDLAARNIQRGRDHGVQSYSAYRTFCQQPALTESWDDRPDEINEQAWGNLRNAYQVESPEGVLVGTPLDIDLYSGGLSENVVSGGHAGPTFVCLMGEQFKALKDGDRFFFTHADQVGSFTLEQLEQLRSRTLGDIICENSPISSLQVNVFEVESDANPVVACNDLSRVKLDLSLYVPKKEDEGTGSSSNLKMNLLTSISSLLFIAFSKYLA